jgi:DNA adenine methylase
MTGAIKPPMPYFGGKITLGPVIADLLPVHEHYVEPFCGSLAVLMAKSASRYETVNDLDGQLMTFWRILRDDTEALARVCALTPHSRAEHRQSYEPAASDLEVARRVWVGLTQGRAGIRRSTGWRHYVKPVGTAPMPDYLDGYVDRMAAAAERLHNVSLESKPALDIIERYGREDGVLLYVDPPYLGSTRSSGSYLHEMGDEAEHIALADALTGVSAAVVLSGYSSPLYDRLYGQWDRREFSAGTGQGGVVFANRTEVLWSNRPIGAEHLFSGASL